MANNLIRNLRELRLHYLADNLDDIVARAQKARWSPLQLIEHVVAKELDDRASRSVVRRLRRAKIGTFKSMTDFDWSWPTHIDRDAVERALHLDFLENAGNVVLAAAQGLGKTMIAKNIAHQAVLAGHPTRVVTASDLLLDLSAQDSPRTLDRRIKYWSSIKLLVIDEIGYLSYDNRNADLLFQVVSRRYETKSLVITTNLGFGEWAKIFPNAASTTALIDRIVHHSLIIPIKGESYRLREATEATEATKPTKRPRKKRS